MEYTYQDNYKDLYPFHTEQVESCKKKVKNILNNLTTTTNTKNYKILHHISLSEFNSLEKHANYVINNFKQVIIVGIGGSALNPRMTTSLAKINSSIDIKYLDTTDPLYCTNIISSLNFINSYFLFITKSGKTIEILSILGVIINKFKKQSIDTYNRNFCFITGKENSPIRAIATNMDALILDHEENLGGRFSTFTNVGIFPGLLAGLNMKAFISGANSVIESLWNKKENSMPALAAVSLFLFNKPLLINIGYLKIFSYYLDWYTQIISESLGKNGKGFTPIKNLGPMDQHSMFQLYLDGPTDKVYTFIYANSINNIQNTIEPTPELKLCNLGDKDLAAINDIEYFATTVCCKEEKLPVRQIILKELCEKSLGALAMHSIIEVIILGNLMQVNPFDQLSVEKIKTQVISLLAKSRDF